MSTQLTDNNTGGAEVLSHDMLLFFHLFLNAGYKSDKSVNLYGKLLTSSNIGKVSKVSRASKYVTVLDQVCLLSG